MCLSTSSFMEVLVFFKMSLKLQVHDIILEATGFGSAQALIDAYKK